MDILSKITEELQVQRWQVEAAVRLLDDGNTVPFVARYRKEATGTLNDEQLRDLNSKLKTYRNLEERRSKIIETITEQGNMTPELKSQIENAETAVMLEDLYRPYRPKRMTRATTAIEKGLLPLAELMETQKEDIDLTKEAVKFVSEEKGVSSAEEAIQGACDIIAEKISDNAQIRSAIRDFTRKEGLLGSKAKNPEEHSVYETYYQFEIRLTKAEGYQILALNRGEKEKILTVFVQAPEEQIIQSLKKKFIHTENTMLKSLMEDTVEDSYQRLIKPGVERELRNELTEKAEEGAIRIFRNNLEQLLMQRPFGNVTILGWDPAFRTGCKLAVVDPTGKVLDTAVIYPTAPTNAQKQKQAADKIKEFILKYHINLISLGNGTASRESEQFLTEVLKQIPQKVSYLITNEAGASVYSASELATKEFPDYDVGQRSAISIARRVLDPLAELVKIDPKSIGVGQYQHDMNQKKLGEALDGVVENCVNTVGVDLNTASGALLSHISGISRTIADNIVALREKNGRYNNRKELLSVPKLGPKAYEQCAGFLRILNGENPLDATGVHPESYEIASKLIQMTDKSAGLSHLPIHNPEWLKKTSEELGIGQVTLESILKELTTAGRDPRMDMPEPILKSDVLSIEDLKEGMILKGTVRNIMDFGAFVDIGVHHDGLVHISQMSDKFVKHPLDVVKVGQIVEVRVISVDVSKQRIGLSMIIK